MNKASTDGTGVSWRTLFRWMAGCFVVFGLLIIVYGLFFQSEPAVYTCVDRFTGKEAPCPVGTPGVAPPVYLNLTWNGSVGVSS